MAMAPLDLDPIEQFGGDGEVRQKMVAESLTDGAITDLHNETGHLTMLDGATCAGCGAQVLSNVSLAGSRCPRCGGALPAVTAQHPGVASKDWLILHLSEPVVGAAKWDDVPALCDRPNPSLALGNVG
jgi:predicted Zn-ribbon and HTH transcriptional regulator